MDFTEVLIIISSKLDIYFWFKLLMIILVVIFQGLDHLTALLHISFILNHIIKLINFFSINFAIKLLCSWYFKTIHFINLQLFELAELIALSLNFQAEFFYSLRCFILVMFLNFLLQLNLNKIYFLLCCGINLVKLIGIHFLVQ